MGGHGGRRRLRAGGPKGSLSLFVQSDEVPDMEYKSPATLQLKQGAGTATFKTRVLVKDVHSLMVIVALYHNDGRSTAVTSHRYFVVDKE